MDDSEPKTLERASSVIVGEISPTKRYHDVISPKKLLFSVEEKNLVFTFNIQELEAYLEGGGDLNIRHTEVIFHSFLKFCDK